MEVNVGSFQADVFRLAGRWIKLPGTVSRCRKQPDENALPETKAQGINFSIVDFPFMCHGQSMPSLENHWPKEWEYMGKTCPALEWIPFP